MNFSSVKRMYIQVNGQTEEVKKVEDANGVVLWKKASRLPAEYQEVEYIQNSRNDGLNQYIDTGCTLTTNARAVVTEEQDVITQYTWQEHGVSGNDSFAFGTYGNNIYYAVNSSDIDTHVAFPFGTKLTHDLNAYSGYYSAYNEVTKTELFRDNNLASFIGSSKSFWLFRYHGGGQHFTYSKLYSAQIYDGTTLLRDLVPCYRKLDSKPGLYDLVNDVFYTNAGSGEFTVGSDV